MTTTQTQSPKKSKIENESSDHIYFTTTPRIVWALSRTPYDLTLWQTIKDIAGDNGECYISTPDLALLSMMSVGQCSDSRAYLLKCGLLKGEVRKDAGYPLAVWHLSVPDLWERSTAWSSKYKSINLRIQFKIEQKDELIKHREKLRSEKVIRGHSPAEMSDISPGERPLSPGEKPQLPGETKNIKQEEQKEEHFGASAPAHASRPKKRDLMDGILFYERLAQDKQVQLADRVNAFPQDVQQTLVWFVEVYNLLPSAIPAKPSRGEKGGDFALWIKELREINNVLEGFGKNGIAATAQPCANLSVSHPGAIMWCLPAEVGKLSRRTLEMGEKSNIPEWKRSIKLYAE